MQIHKFLGADTVELEEVLLERELRVETQRRLLRQGTAPLICLSMNMAGPVKDFPLLRCAFEEGKRLTETALARTGISFCFLEQRQNRCGSCAFYHADGPLETIKRLLCAVEDTALIGRLLDLDVLDGQAKKLSRKEIGLAPRRCLLCEEEAAVCGRSRRHTVEELQRETVRILLDSFSSAYADHVSACASRAMLYEISISPKPGLVDRLTNGAHQDMNFFTFLDSCAALTPWFRRFCIAGFDGAELSDEALFASVRQLGKEADAAMFSATRGVNTHKGLVFSVGLLCTAAGQLYQRNLAVGITDRPAETEIRARAAALAAWSLPDLERPELSSNGIRVFRIFRARGVRQEAALGFPSVAEHVLPYFRTCDTLEAGGQRALLALLANVTDTNVLHRGGEEALCLVRECAVELLASGDADLSQQMGRLDEVFSSAGISPGGCADLLAVGLFLYFL